MTPLCTSAASLVSPGPQCILEWLEISDRQERSKMVTVPELVVADLSVEFALNQKTAVPPAVSNRLWLFGGQRCHLPFARRSRFRIGAVCGAKLTPVRLAPRQLRAELLQLSDRNSEPRTPSLLSHSVFRVRLDRLEPSASRKFLPG